MKRTILLLYIALAVSTAQAQTVVQAWVQRYHGPGNTADFAKAIAVDKNGNAFVTGYSYATNGTTEYATVAYSSTGLPLWTNRYNETATGSRAQASAMALDNSGNVFVTGYAGGGLVPRHYATIKYSGGGIPLWTNLYYGPGSSGQATAIAVATNGNVFVTGYSQGTHVSDDYATIAYSSEGAGLWTNRYSGLTNGEAVPTAIAVDVNGNVFVTGGSAKTTMSPSNPRAYATIKYSSDGIPMWTNRFADGGTFIDEYPTAIVVDGDGNVFVTGGSFRTIANQRDYATLAYSSAGVALWTNRYNGPGNGDDLARAITVDNSGNVFVTGSSSADYLTLAYSSAGVALWTNRYNGPGNNSDSPTAIAADTNGNVYVTGQSVNGTNGDYATIAYSNAGMPLWTKHYDSGNPAAIAVDTIGNVYVTGIAVPNGGYGDYTTIKYSFSRPLTIQMIENQVVLSWTNAASSLQTAPTITGTFTNLPGAESPYTNPITGVQQFFRLISN